MKHAVKTLVALTLILAVCGLPSTVAGEHGVDDLRGRWEFVVSEGFEEPLIFDLYINELGPDPGSQTGNDYLAAGCMASPGIEGMTPLLLRATSLGDGAFDLSLLSTAVRPPGEGEPFVIQFLGTVSTHDSDVPDDEAGGQVRTNFTEGAWTGTHHDRRRTSCPPVGDIPIPGLYFFGDVYAHHGYWGEDIITRWKLLEGFTNIVSLGMRVEWPDGTVVVVPFYTDIFSPGVDFVSEFRYLESFPGNPISGEPYTFTLLDGLGNPIPGTTVTDVWTGCETYPPARDLDAAMSAMDIDLSWAPVPDVPGFDPDDSQGQGQRGFYQIGLWPHFDGNTNYGANLVISPEHLIPWERHGNWDLGGSPDGEDHGYPLGELEDGLYQLQVEAYSQPNPANPGFGLECAVWDEAENLFLVKAGDEMDFLTFGSIAGTVQDESGNPLANIAVDIQEGGFGTCTDEFGHYLMRGLSLGTYNVVGGRDFCGEHPYTEQTVSGVELSEGAPNATVNFVLPLGGSIAGTVRDSYGNPIPNIAVDIQEGGFGTCTDEFGHYLMQRLPLGTYNVVAGRDFCGPHSYVEQTVLDVELSEGAPNATGIDFVLPLGGSIAGTVRDSYGNPIPNIAVDIQEGGFGTCTDEFGHYLMQRLPLGTYNVVAGRDFCGPHSYVEQTVLDVELSESAPNATGIDFVLPLGGSIAGTVRDSYGNPIPNIAVDVEEGGFGTCTDEFGHYLMQRLPLGTYDVVAGRDFCADHPYAEQAVSGVELSEGAPDATGIDFELGPTP